MKSKKKLCDGCGELRHIWKNVKEDSERKRYCKSCWSCQNSKSIKPTANRKPIRSRSPKRSAQERVYSKTRKVFLESNPLCQIVIPGICTNNATDIHHVDGRVEDKLTDDAGFKSSCRSCHRWVHNHPVEARDLGHLI